MPLRLNFGAGDWRSEGWTSVDIDSMRKPDVLLDLRRAPYPFKSDRADLILASLCDVLWGREENPFEIALGMRSEDG
jgi:predicted SAM-dependent methyltransferase